MTELSEARARAVEARDEARNHVEKFPISEGDAVRVARLADVIDALLAVRRPSTPTEEQPSIEAVRALEQFIVRDGRPEHMLIFQGILRSHEALFERVNAAPTEEDVERAAVALVEFDGYDASNPDWSHGFYSFYVEKARAALSAVHLEVTQ